MRSRLPQRKTLELGTHQCHFPHFLQIEGSHPHAAAGFADRQSLCFQLAERLPDRHMARTEFLGNVILPQFRTRLQLAGYDPVGKNTADAVGDGVCIR